jgi:flotillin
MFDFSPSIIAGIAVLSVVFVVLLIWVMSLRRVVSTDTVHIVQRKSSTVSYGVGCDKNAYYEWPSWLPFLGITVRELPITNFDITLDSYPAYDKDRLPFLVDIKAFFRIDNTNLAASRVQDFKELKDQLSGIVQGTVRSVLAKSKLEEIMEERSLYGEQFTKSVYNNLTEWGIVSSRNIELMDVRDDKTSEVIANIMAKKKSAIEMESRVTVAENIKTATEAEIVANQKVEVQKAESVRIVGEAKADSDKKIEVANADAEQAKGVAKALADKEVGIAKELAEQSIQEQAKVTAEKHMAVNQVNEVKAAEIAKQKAIVQSEQEKEQIRIKAEAEQRNVQIATDAKKYEIENVALAQLEAEKRRAEGIKVVGTNEASVILAKGTSEAEAEKLKQLASVTAQTTLAKEVGENLGYQNYLIKIKEVEASVEIGVQQAKSYGEALGKADLKIIANSGDVNGGINKITDVLSSKGGQAVNGLIESLQQTELGGELVTGLLDKLSKGKANPKA